MAGGEGRKTKAEIEREKFEALGEDDKIRYHYQHGQGSIQDIARVYKRTVDEVLEILEMDDMTGVRTQGDLVDPSELKGSKAQYNPEGDLQPSNYSTN